MQEIITDRQLVNFVLGCSSYKQIPEVQLFYKWMNDILFPVFDEFQEHKKINDIYYMEKDMQRSLSNRLNNLSQKEKKYREFFKTCVSNYYRMFKDKWYQRYKVLNLSRKYLTNNLEYNIEGTVDLTLKTSYGITLFNYSYQIDPVIYYYDLQLNATRLQIAGRCMKLMDGKVPDLLGIIFFTRRKIFRLYFKYIDQPYEEYLKILAADLEPIKIKYCHLCKTCSVKSCTPFKTREQLLI